ncbi:colicin V synthesis protein [Advenella sp. S44]|uniref:CvpA family protein n=1 Tax=Advenella sp. S44 TaxID=1982755 RepID=UPI000C2A2035|nr:CvpA family protein [Advenella sp. S44]PJX26499.1 colicin V synthesis protein [Advenella sp. S44]
MTEFDYTCLGIIAISGLLGLMRGFLKEAFSLIAYAAAFIGAIWWGPVVYPWVMQYINNALISMGIGYAVVFIAILLIVGLVNVTLATLIEATGLGPADQGLGILFGIARGVVIILILVVLAGYTPFPKEPWWVNARFSPMATMAVQQIKLRLPDSIGSYLPY